MSRRLLVSYDSGIYFFSSHEEVVVLKLLGTCFGSKMSIPFTPKQVSPYRLVVLTVKVRVSVTRVEDKRQGCVV